MRRHPFASVLVVVALSACNETTAPSRLCLGSYTLAAVNGSLVPTPKPNQMGDVTIESGSFTVHADSTFGMTQVVSMTVLNSTKTDTLFDSGSFVMQNGRLTFQDTSGYKFSATVSGRRMRVTDGGDAYLYEQDVQSTCSQYFK